MAVFEKGEVYHRRRDLHDQFGGQVQGGISTPSGQDFIMLFTSERGEQYGYVDHWKGEIFFYTGEGQMGDMSFTRGNKAIRDHIANNKALYLFTYVKKGYVEFTAELEYVTHQIKQGRDWKGMMRAIIIFELRKV